MFTMKNHDIVLLNPHNENYKRFKYFSTKCGNSDKRFVTLTFSLGKKEKQVCLRKSGWIKFPFFLKSTKQ